MTELHLARHVPGGDPVLLLLHGLGATGEVWHDLLERNWPGEVLAPDLPGHGRSPRLPEYTFESMAAAVAAVVPAGRKVVVLGHSLGGVLALTLADGTYGFEVTAACGLGIKLRWTEAELAKAAEVAARPERVFATRDEAVDRWLKVSGLAGLVAPDSPRVAAGVVESDDGWRVAVDPKAFGVGAPDVFTLLTRAKGETILAAGSVTRCARVSTWPRSCRTRSCCRGSATTPTSKARCRCGQSWTGSWRRRRTHSASDRCPPRE